MRTRRIGESVRPGSSKLMVGVVLLSMVSVCPASLITGAVVPGLIFTVDSPTVLAGGTITVNVVNDWDVDLSSFQLGGIAITGEVASVGLGVINDPAGANGGEKP